MGGLSFGVFSLPKQRKDTRQPAKPNSTNTVKPKTGSPAGETQLN
jgi:hypothetical protein